MNCAKPWIMLLLATGTAQGGEIVLFDAATTPRESVVSQGQAAFAFQDGLLQIETKGGTGYPGVLIKGAWNLSGCNRVTFELVNRDKKGELPITVRLDNPDADPGKSRGVFVDRVKISGQGVKSYEVTLPPWLPNAREIQAKLDGMRKGPFATRGVVADLNPAQVVGVAVYIKEPKLDWLWGVKRIVAHSGPVPEVPDWMRLPAEKFFPFIDRYGQFMYKEWPGKIHGDAELQQALEKEEADLAAHPGPEGWNEYGGWAAGPRQKATGHFRAEKVDGKWWFIDPAGCLYWSHGPVRVTSSSAVTPLDGREFYFTDLPTADSPFALFYTTRDALLWPYYEARDQTHLRFLVGQRLSQVRRGLGIAIRRHGAPPAAQLGPEHDRQQFGRPHLPAGPDALLRPLRTEVARHRGQPPRLVEVQGSVPSGVPRELPPAADRTPGGVGRSVVHRVLRGQ